MAEIVTNIPLTYREASGELISPIKGKPVELDADVANALKADGLGSDYSGGGSSDLSVATVTTTVNDDFMLEIGIVSIFSDGVNEGLVSTTTFANDLETELVLYKGATEYQFTDADLGDYKLLSASGSGGVSITQETDPVFHATIWKLRVTGDGSLNLTMDWKQ